MYQMEINYVFVVFLGLLIVGAYYFSPFDFKVEDEED
ncbi:hypothetical protein Solca_4288 [Solitalea canadensis DSM 3403]|uniref:Uncharacterized protein n=1 Tax=Solitalea canadensis (strain ATCC 29591 / DSM 3403 / JCM 21819 / LMG 8368 / NBRC 15130 / NCIMB 12057 / USAM 9D) TaxID=929556 RepID=H8KM96_SOLCM|nr:hypothetical protein Solca_4288 [Solitalea canadensis DSM 3403]